MAGGLSIASGGSSETGIGGNVELLSHSLSYVDLFRNLIANVVNNNYQHVRSGTNVRMSQNPHLRRKRMGTGIIIVSRTTITLRPGQGRAAGQLYRGSDADADADADAEGCNGGYVFGK